MPRGGSPRNPGPFRGMCAVRNYLKHVGRMDPSYPVHVQRRHARDRLVHLIHEIFRCCGGRFRRGGAKSADQTHELPRNRGRTPFPRGEKYLDPRSPPSISRAYEQRPGLFSRCGVGSRGRTPVRSNQSGAWRGHPGNARVPSANGTARPPPIDTGGTRVFPGRAVPGESDGHRRPAASRSA